MSLNPELIKLARFTVGKQRVKQAVQPPPQDPSQGGGAPPTDPSMMGGAGGAPVDPSMMGGAGGAPVDPSMMGGAGSTPPIDPSMIGAAGGALPVDPSTMAAAAGAGPGGAPPVPGAGGLTADTIREIMQETLGQLGMVPGQPGPGGTAAGGKPGKPDLLAMSMDIFQIKKMMSTLFSAMGIPLPQDILDGPNRDPVTGVPVPPNTPGSTSDPTKQSPPAGGGASGTQPQSAIKPISPIQAAFPTSDHGRGGREKSSSTLGEEEPRRERQGRDVRNKASALNAVLRRKLKV